jgi:hypothetical protein
MTLDRLKLEALVMTHVIERHSYPSRLLCSVSSSSVFLFKVLLAQSDHPFDILNYHMREFYAATTSSWYPNVNIARYVYVQRSFELIRDQSSCESFHTFASSK